MTNVRDRWMRAGLPAVVVLAGGCAVGASDPVRPAALAPAHDAPAVRLPAVAEPVFTPLPPLTDDPIVTSRWASHPDLAERIDYWTEYWQGRGARDFQIYLERLHWYGAMVEAEIEAQGLPRSLLYLPILESGYTARAVSHASAVGLWQFVAVTARARGLEVTPILDERRDPVKATPQALGFLSELYDRFGSWYLALAAYNGGPSRMSGLLRRETPLAPLSDSLFIALRPELPRETQDFVPKLIAASRLASEPLRYGFHLPEGPTFEYDEIEIETAVSVDVIARAAQVSQEEIETLNPQLLRGFTPPNASTTVRVPRGASSGFVERFASIPESERLSFLEHRVVSGETFTHIARRYGVGLSTLRAANPNIEPRRLQIGQWVVVPVAPRSVSRPGSRSPQ